MNILRNSLNWLTKHNLPLSLRLRYFYYFKKCLRLRNPKTLDEKIQWMKIHLYGYDQDPIYTQCADKYRVRDYVKSCGCSEILNELIAVYDTPEEIEWGKLPQKFALKWNFGNGYNIICHNKSSLNIPQTKDKLKIWGKEEPWLKTGEVQYKHAEKKIIVEKFIEPERGLLPVDYKVFCFHGEPFILFTCEERDSGTPKFYFFDKKWNLIRINPDGQNAPANFSLPKPKHLNSIFHYAEILSQRFPFVRVDFYDTPQRLYFGELTFTPGGGFDIERLWATQLMLGSKLDLSKVNIKP